MQKVTDEQLMPQRREPRNFWERTGVTPAQQKVLDGALYALVAVFLIGWTYSAATAWDRGEGPLVARRLAADPTPGDGATDVTFLMNAAISRVYDWEEELRGESGAVRVLFREPGDTLELPDSLPAGVDVAFRDVEDTTALAAADGAPEQPGIWNLLLRMRGAIREVTDFNVVTLVPAAEAEGGSIGAYRIGAWPRETGIYAPPRGFVRVTPENVDTPVSTHFVIGDFLTKGQEDVWPKYVVLSERLLDKLELTLQELEEMGHPVEDVFVISGFRTPWYNEAGGNTQGRGALSRHMYGDAADIAIDNDGDRRMDDLNGDGRVTVADARVIVEAAERVERKYPHLIGGIGTYAPTGAHAGMVHIDTRGHRARW